MRKRKARTSRGAQISEFAAALVLLVMCLLIPLLDLGILPVRCFLSQNLIQSYARKLALCETLSQAFAVMEADPSLQTQLQRLGGVRPSNIQLSLSITQTFGGAHTEVYQPNQIPPEWLPGGGNSPCDYILQLNAQCEITPVIILAFGGPKVPGLNAPIRMTISATAPWENLGRDPLTKQFFMNE